MTQEEAYSWAAHRCATREMCPSDIVVKLREKGVEENDIDDIVHRLIEENYLDTGRYARAFVHDKLFFQQWGKKKLHYHLFLKGIVEADIQAAFAEIDEEEYRSLLKKVLRSKGRSLCKDDAAKRRQKLAAYAESKGFELSLVFRCIDEIAAEEEEEVALLYTHPTVTLF